MRFSVFRNYLVGVNPGNKFIHCGHLKKHPLRQVLEKSKKVFIFVLDLCAA